MENNNSEELRTPTVANTIDEDIHHMIQNKLTTLSVTEHIKQNMTPHPRDSRVHPMLTSLISSSNRPFQDIKFHSWTGRFIHEPQLEELYNITNARQNSVRSSRITLIFLIMYLFFTGSNILHLFSSDREERTETLRYCLVVFIPMIPVPFLIYASHHRYFEKSFQHVYSVIILCWATSILGGGMFSMLIEWYSYISKDAVLLMDTLGIMNDLDTTYYVNSTTLESWPFQSLQGSRQEVFLQYTRHILLPAATMNINLLRLIMVFVFVPVLRIDTVHSAFISLVVCLIYAILTFIIYPVTESAAFTQNRILVLCFPIVFAIAMLIRNRDLDRVTRQEFLNLWTMELEAQRVNREKNLIAEENRNLKKELAQRDNEFTLDLTSPLHSILNELKSFIDETEMNDISTNRGYTILRTLASLDTNLFTPDIKAHVAEPEIDKDTKNWALSVLTKREYTGAGRHHGTQSHSSLSNSYQDRLYSTTEGSVKIGDNIVVPLPDLPLWEYELLEKVKFLIQKDGWDLDTLEIAEMTTNRSLMYITTALFDIHDLHDEFRIDRVIFHNFLFVVESGYMLNPYHNSCHAADVVNSVNYLMTSLGDGYLRDSLTSLEFYAALIAAVIHDFRHPGKSNNYLIKAKHDLSIQYNDRSILESMHLAETFFLMKNPSCNILGRMKDKPYREIRKAIVEMVLSTDLSLHLQLVGSLQAVLLQESAAAGPVNVRLDRLSGSGDHNNSKHHSGGNSCDSKSDRLINFPGRGNNTKPAVSDPMMIMKTVIKCADIGHASKQRRLHVLWSSLIIEEFFLQGDDERNSNTEISPFMDRDSENSAKNQIGFFEYIVLPFYDTVSQAVFTREFSHIHATAKKNYQLWKESDKRQLTSIVAIRNEVFLNDDVQV